MPSYSTSGGAASASGFGSSRLATIAAELRAAGERGNLLALRRGVRKAAKPLVPAVKAAALRELPKGGGLNKYVAGQRITVSVRLSARTTDVRLTTSTPATKQTDRGWVRHPTWGRRGEGQWKSNTIPVGGWWTDTLAQQASAIRPELVAAIDTVAAKIASA